MSAGAAVTVPHRREATAFRVLAGISVAHLLNDTVQSIVPAIYPMVKESFALSFTQIGLLTLTLQLTASLLQPLVGLYTDHRPSPYALVVGMGVTLAGLLLLAGAPTYGAVLVAAALMGIGSAVFHPESSRVARMASGGRPGLAQSLFQVGGNIGSSFGPLLAAFLILPHGLSSIAWCSSLAVVAIGILWRIGGWYRERYVAASAAAHDGPAAAASGVSRRRVRWAIAILCALLFSKYVYLASLTSYYTFYLISKFHVSVRTAQIDLFVFLLAVGIRTIRGGPIGVLRVERQGDPIVARVSVRQDGPPELASRRERHIGQPGDRGTGNGGGGRGDGERADHFATTPGRQDGSIVRITSRVGIVVGGLLRPVIESRNVAA